MTETFQITLEQAEAYEELFVPALFAQWAPMMVDLAGLDTGHRVLDVGCGTGVASKAAMDRVGPTGSVVGLDLNPAMLEVASRTRADIEWRHGDAAELPWADAAFDAVLCQSAVFFFPDVDAAVFEMARVVEQGRRVVIQSYAALADQPGFQELDAVVRRIAPGDAVELMDIYWSQGDLTRLGLTVTRAGLELVESRTVLGTVLYGSVENMIEVEVKGTPLVDRISDAQIERILSEAEDLFSGYLDSEGRLAMPIRALFVAGLKA